jgi:CRP/FNR family transcriptional regulator, cyclic AMP receptor protein
MTEQASIIGAEPFLRGLPADCIARLASMSRHISQPAHSRLFDEGVLARSFWIIDAGQVALDALVPGVGRVVIDTLGRGDVLGLSWLEPPYQVQCGAITTQPLQAFEFDAARVREACRNDPVFGQLVLDRFLAIATQRLHATRTRLVTALAEAAAGQSARGPVT